jgi:hypothetical protein
VSPGSPWGEDNHASVDQVVGITRVIVHLGGFGGNQAEVPCCASLEPRKAIKKRGVSLLISLHGLEPRKEPSQWASAGVAD